MGITNLKYCVELPLIFTSSFMLNVLLSNILVVILCSLNYIKICNLPGLHYSIKKSENQVSLHLLK